MKVVSTVQPQVWQRAAEFPTGSLVEDVYGTVYLLTYRSGQGTFILDLTTPREDYTFRTPTWDRDSFRRYTGTLTLTNK